MALHSDVEPLVVNPRDACRLLGCGLTRLYELIDAGEVESFRDGRSRRVTVQSIKARSRPTRSRFGFAISSSGSTMKRFGPLNGNL